MADTITSFYTFTPNTVAKSAQVNNNFSAFRGDLIPINTNTQTASDNTHNLGTTDHRWKTGRFGTSIEVGGQTFAASDLGAGTFIKRKFSSCALTATSNNTWSSDSNRNPLGLFFDDCKCRIGVERVVFKDIAIYNDKQGDPNSKQYNRLIFKDQYGNFHENISLYAENFGKQTAERGGDYFIATSITSLLYVTDVYTKLNLLSRCNSIFLESMTSYVDASSTTNIFNQANFTFDSMGVTQLGITPLCGSVAANELHTFKGLKYIPYSDWFNIQGIDLIYVNGSSTGVYAGGTFFVSGNELSLATSSFGYTPASYTGSKGGRVARYLYRDTNGVAQSVLTITSILEAGTLACTGQANTTTVGIGQNDGNYINGTIIRLAGTAAADNMLNYIVSGASASGTSFVMLSTLSTNYTTTNCFLEHYANAYPAATFGSSTLAAEYRAFNFGVGLPGDFRYGFCLGDNTYTDSMAHVFQNASGFVYGASPLGEALISASTNPSYCVIAKPTNTAQIVFGDYCTGIGLVIRQYQTSTSVIFRLYVDGVDCGTVTAPQTITAIEIPLLSDAPAGQHIVRIISTNTSDYLQITAIRYYIPKQPTFTTNDSYLIQQEYMLQPNYRIAPALNTGVSVTVDRIDQGVIHQSMKHNVVYNADTTWNASTYVGLSSACDSFMAYNASNTSWFRFGFWGTAFIIRGVDANAYSALTKVQYSNDGSTFSDLTSTTLTHTQGYTGLVNPWTNGSTNFDMDVENGSYPGKMYRIYSLPLNYYYIKLTNQTNATQYFLGIDYWTPIYDFKSHHIYKVGGCSAYNQIQYSPVKSLKSYAGLFDKAIYNTGWYSVNAASTYMIGPTYYSNLVSEYDPNIAVENFVVSNFGAVNASWNSFTSGGSALYPMKTEQLWYNGSNFIGCQFSKSSQFDRVRVNVQTSTFVLNNNTNAAYYNTTINFTEGSPHR